MQTFLTQGTGSSDPKQLTLFAKKRFETSDDVRLTVKSWLNTVTTSAKVDASLLKFFRIGSRPLFSADDVYKPDQRPRLGIGVKISSIRPEDAVLTFDVKQKKRLAKSTDYVRGRHVLNSYTQAHARANYDYDIKKDTWSGKGEIGVSHAMFRFADDQDVRFTAGTQCSLSSRGITNPQPFVKFEENNWSLAVTSNGQRSSWRISYAL